jgi:hypothetical protein
LGHLYVNRVGSGIALVIVDLMLLGLAATGIGLIIAVPIWVVLFLVASVRVTGHVRRGNLTGAS